MIKACTTGITPIVDEPNNPGENTTAKELISFNYKHSKYLQEADEWEENNSKLYICFMEHCSPSMETKLQSMDGFEAVEEDQDGLELIKLLRKA